MHKGTEVNTSDQNAVPVFDFDQGQTEPVRGEAEDGVSTVPAATSLSGTAGVRCEGREN